MTYFERLRDGGPLFEKIAEDEAGEALHQEKRQQEFLKSNYGVVLYNLENLPASA